MKVGDQVYYIPTKDFCLKRDSTGHYPWVLGIREVVKGEEIIKELSEEELDKFVANFRRSHQQDVLRAKIVLIRNHHTYPGIIIAIHDDKTVDVDVNTNDWVTNHITHTTVGSGPGQVLLKLEENQVI